jgi:uncharacterized repeat protein (TIGR01451 family)
MKYLVSSFIITILFAFVATPAFADTCQTTSGVYGNNCPPSLGLTIDKKVQNPESKDFVDNMGMNDPKFGPQQSVLFQLKVKNTGNKQLDQVFVKDLFPSVLTFAGGQGSFNVDTRTLTFEINDLKVGEERTYTVAGKIVSADKLPNEIVSCVINQAFATTNTMATSDNAQFCIQQKVTTKGGHPVYPAPKVAATPATGSESFALLGLIPAVFAGYKLRRKASK